MTVITFTVLSAVRTDGNIRSFNVLESTSQYFLLFL